MNHATRFTAAALIGLAMTGFQSARGDWILNSARSPMSRLLTTQSAQTPVAGRDYTALYTLDLNGVSGARVIPLVFRNDGSVVVSKNPPGVHGNLIAQSQVGIQSRETRTWFLAQSGGKPRQAIEAATRGKSIVWLETKSTDLYSQDWRIYAGIIGKSKPTLLADSFSLLKTDQIPIPPGVTTLATDGVNAWWVMVYPTKKSPSGWGVRIMVRDIGARGALKIAVDRAILPIAIQQGLVYVRSKSVDSSMTSNHYEIRLLKNGVDTLISSGPLIKDEAVSSICASKTVLAWAVHSPSATLQNSGVDSGGRLHVMTLTTKVQRVIALNDSAWGLSLGCGTNFVAWGNGSGNGDPGQYVLNVPSGKIWKLGSSPGDSAVNAAGDILAWTLHSKSARQVAPWKVVMWHGV